MIERLREEDLAPDGLDPADGREGSPRGTPGAGGVGEEDVEGEGSAAGGGAAAESALSIEAGELRSALEAALFSVSEPITIRALSELFSASVHEVREAVEELRLEYIDSGRAFRIEDIAGGIQVLTLPRYDPWIRRLRQKEGEGRLSPAAMESLAVIAYKQPINKADLEAIRGVGCGPTLKTLLDRGLVQIVGRGEGLGKPLLYGTTRRFLEAFAISSVRELPQPELSERPSEAPGDAPPGAMGRTERASQVSSEPEATPDAAPEPVGPEIESPDGEHEGAVESAEDEDDAPAAEDRFDQGFHDEPLSDDFQSEPPDRADPRDEENP